MGRVVLRSGLWRRRNEEGLERFELARDGEAWVLSGTLLAAGREEERMSGRTWFDVPQSDTTPLRHAVEVRHPSFEAEEGAWTALLERHGVASVVADTAGR